MKLSDWRWYFSLGTQTRARLLAITLLSTLQSLLLCPIPLLIRQLFHFESLHRAAQPWWLIGSSLLLCSASHWMGALSFRIALRLVKTQSESLKQILLSRIYSLPLSAFWDQRERHFQTILLSDTEKVGALFQSLVLKVIPAILVMCLMGLVLASLNWRVCLVLVASFPLIFFSSQQTRKKVRLQAEAVRDSSAKLGRRFFHSLRAMELIRLFAAETAERRALEQEVKRVTHLELSFRETENQLLNQQTFFFFLICALATWLLSLWGNPKALTGEFVSFYLALGLIRGQFGAIASFFPQWVVGSRALRVIRDFLDSSVPPPVVEGERISFQGQLELCGLGFQYANGSQIRYPDVFLKPGSVLIVSGHNGTGKTTLLKLITGVLTPTTGALFADGRPYSTLNLDFLRQQMGVITQDPFILTGSLRDNFRFSTEAEEGVWWEALFEVGLSDFVRSRPEGLDWFVGEGGSLLSGGQRQRLAIARALCRDPKLCLLDEPSNHLGSETTHRMLSRWKAQGQRTFVVITHDPALFTLGDSHLALSSHPAFPQSVPMPRPKTLSLNY